MSRHDKRHEEAAAERWLLAVAMENYRQQQQMAAKVQSSADYIPPDRERYLRDRAELLAYLNKAEERQRRVRASRRLRVALVVAAVVALLCSTVAMADRVGWLHYITETLEQYTWSWSARIAPLDKPEGWESEYYPTWVPDGFRYVDCFNGETYKSIWYETTDGRGFVFSISPIDYDYDNTENMQLYSAKINGVDATVYYTDDWLHSAVWIPCGNIAIFIYGDVNVDEICAIAENTKNF